MNLYKVEIKYPKRPARFAYLHIQGINLLRAVELTTNIIKTWEKRFWFLIIIADHMFLKWQKYLQ
jgi:hypothetical protein